MCLLLLGLRPERYLTREFFVGSGKKGARIELIDVLWGNELYWSVDRRGDRFVVQDIKRNLNEDCPHIVLET